MVSIRNFNFNTNTIGSAQNERSVVQQTSYVYFGNTINASKMLTLMNALTKQQQVKIVCDNPNVKRALSILKIHKVAECIER